MVVDPTEAVISCTLRRGRCRPTPWGPARPSTKLQRCLPGFHTVWRCHLARENSWCPACIHNIIYIYTYILFLYICFFQDSTKNQWKADANNQRHFCFALITPKPNNVADSIKKSPKSPNSLGSPPKVRPSSAVKLPCCGFCPVASAASSSCSAMAQRGELKEPRVRA